MGSPGDLAAALQILERDGPPLGLHLNRGKSLLFIPEDADADQSPLPPELLPPGLPSWPSKLLRRDLPGPD